MWSRWQLHAICDDTVINCDGKSVTVYMHSHIKQKLTLTTYIQCPARTSTLKQKFRASSTKSDVQDSDLTAEWQALSRAAFACCKWVTPADTRRQHYTRRAGHQPNIRTGIYCTSLNNEGHEHHQSPTKCLQACLCLNRQTLSPRAGFCWSHILYWDLCSQLSMPISPENTTTGAAFSSQRHGGNYGAWNIIQDDGTGRGSVWVWVTSLASTNWVAWLKFM